MRWLPAMAFLLIPAACATSGGEAPAVSAARNASISMQTSSWGRPVSEWRIEGDGDGSYTVTRDVPGGGFRDYDVVTRRFSAVHGSFERVEALMAAAERGIECEPQISDAGYGTIEWVARAGEPVRRDFDYGCLSPAASRAYAGMAEAERLVSAWAAAGEVTETRQVREPRPQP
jgi:hypothetical protein